MILSRVADGLYWMGRYLERAENTVRLLLVAEELSTEVFGLDEDLARSEWHDLGEIFPGPALPERTTRQVASLAAISLQALTFSAAHPNSVYFSLKRARDNARGVREALTLEVFVNLNETYRELEEAAKRRLVDTPSFRSALGSTVSVKFGPLKPARASGGACQMKATAPESRFSELLNFQPAQPPVARPLSNGKLV